MSKQQLWNRLGAAGMLLAYIIIKINAADLNKVQMMKDSLGYLDYPSWRPITVPFIFHFFKNTHQIVHFQFILSTISWGFLALVIFLYFKPRILGFIVSIITLMFSLSHTILQWDFSILSESITFSLMALTVGLLFFLYETTKNPKASLLLQVLITLILIVVQFFFINTRDSNLYLLLLIIPFVMVTFYRKRQLKTLLVITLFVVATIGTYVYQSNQANFYFRWKAPLQHVILQRVLYKKQELNYFKAHGMPVTKEVLKQKGQRKIVLVGHDLMAFDFWLDSKGKSTYQKYLMTHALRTLPEAIKLIPHNFNHVAIDTFYGDVGLSNQTEHISNWLFFRINHPYRWLFPLLMLPVLLLIFNRRHWRLYMTAGFAWAACVSQVYIGTLGDTVEPVRHVLMGDVLFRFTILLNTLSMIMFSRSFFVR